MEIDHKNVYNFHGKRLLYITNCKHGDSENLFKTGKLYVLKKYINLNQTHK
jgi:hypothetical protein